MKIPFTISVSHSEENYGIMHGVGAEDCFACGFLRVAKFRSMRPQIGSDQSQTGGTVDNCHRVA